MQGRIEVSIKINNFKAQVAQLKTKPKPKMNLCKNFLLGNCQFAEYCQYAHGLRDLQNPLYKTKMCKNLPNCIYGDNCINAHSNSELYYHSKVVMN